MALIKKAGETPPSIKLLILCLAVANSCFDGVRPASADDPGVIGLSCHIHNDENPANNETDVIEVDPKQLVTVIEPEKGKGPSTTYTNSGDQDWGEQVIVSSLRIEWYSTIHGKIVDDTTIDRTNGTYNLIGDDSSSSWTGICVRKSVQTEF